MVGPAAAAPLSELLFDRTAYLQTLPHIGMPISIAGYPYPLLRRPVAGSDAFDVMGPWPYGSIPSVAQLAAARPLLEGSGALTLTLIARPGWQPATPDGYETRFLKQHFVIDPALPPTPLSARARSNFALACRSWTIDARPAREEAAAVAAMLFADLLQRRKISDIARVPSEHFERLFALPELACLAIGDSEGIGGLVMAAQDASETHLLHLLLAPRAMRSNGSYLLMESVRDLWVPRGPVYLGGVPDGAANAGIGKFKQRWANRCVEIHMVTAILDPARYEALSRHRAPGYFPAYRGPLDA